MTFTESISTCFKKYFVIQGRASKSEFWWFQLLWSASFFIMFIFEESEPVTYFFYGIIVIIFIPLFTVGVRRLHDTGKSGFYYFWSLVPFIGSLIVLAFMLGDGTKGRNQYGDNPLKKSKRKNILSSISISGIFFLKKNFLTKIKKVKIDLTDLIIKKLNKEKFYSYFSNEKFSDFGTLDRYKNLNKNFKLMSEKKAIIFDRDGTIISEKKLVNSRYCHWRNID